MSGAANGEWALVTGASGGIGAALAVQAAQAGYGVILSARQADRLAEVADYLSQAHGVPTCIIPADLGQGGEAERLWIEASTGRRIAVLVNNAGLGHFGDFSEPHGWAREEQTLAVNIASLSVLMKAAVNTMAARGAGRILNVASTAAFQPGPHFAVYCASKAYVLSLSEAVAEELAGSGVTVTALCPGATATGFFSAAEAEDATWLTRAGMADPERVAAAGWRAMMAGRRIRITGMQNKALVFALRFLPRRLVTWAGGMLLKRR